MTSYYVWISIFCILAYFIVTDQSIAQFTVLLYKLLEVNSRKLYWIIRFHPRNPITNLIKRWEYNKIAKELMKEFED